MIGEMGLSRDHCFIDPFCSNDSGLLVALGAASRFNDSWTL